MVGASVLCELCGNDLDPAWKICPYCNQHREHVYNQEKREYFRVVNLERGMPLVQDAVKRLNDELAFGRHSGLKVLVFIHGYGSTGKGGVIKDGVRAALKGHRGTKVLSDILPGEDCGRHSPHARQLLKRFPKLGNYLNRSNPGITLVVL